MLHSKARMPFGGFMARYAIDDIYRLLKTPNHAGICEYACSVRTVVSDAVGGKQGCVPIALYRGSLSKEQAQNRSHDGKRHAEGNYVSALELGIDWGDVDKVIQVGAPKGVNDATYRAGEPQARRAVKRCRTGKPLWGAGMSGGDHRY